MLFICPVLVVEVMTSFGLQFCNFYWIGLYFCKMHHYCSWPCSTDYILLLKWNFLLQKQTAQLGIRLCEWLQKGFFIRGNKNSGRASPHLCWFQRQNYLKIAPAHKHTLIIWFLFVLLYKPQSFIWIMPLLMRDGSGIKKGLELDNHFVSRWPVVFNDWSIRKILHPCWQQWKLLIHNFQPNNLFQYADRVIKPTQGKINKPYLLSPKELLSLQLFLPEPEVFHGWNHGFLLLFPLLRKDTPNWCQNLHQKTNQYQTTRPLILKLFREGKACKIHPIVAKFCPETSHGSLISSSGNRGACFHVSSMYSRITSDSTMGFPLCTSTGTCLLTGL